MVNLILKSAVDSVINYRPLQRKPSANEVVNCLNNAEKECHKNRIHYRFPDLIGTWRLCFITGTKKSRQSLEKLKFIGSGFYVPSFIRIMITYSELKSELNSNCGVFKGKVENTVTIGLVKFNLTGPAKFIAQKNILAFDFTNLTFSLFGINLYNTDIRGGKNAEIAFYQKSIKNQAFFAYFLVAEKIIAARGRGGGLALWVKE
jgi:hypothetical protein